MNTQDELLTHIVRDLYLVTKHVARQPVGYAGFQVDRAKFLMHTVDVDVLHDLLHDVLFTSDWLRTCGPLTKTERQVQAAARRLDGLRRSIRARQPDIQARMAA